MEALPKYPLSLSHACPESRLLDAPAPAADASWAGKQEAQICSRILLPFLIVFLVYHPKPAQALLRGRAGALLHSSVRSYSGVFAKSGANSDGSRSFGKPQLAVS